jgi:toxin ParE1/3/4
VLNITTQFAGTSNAVRELRSDSEEVERVLGAIISNPELFPRYDAENQFALLKRFPYSIVYQVYENRIYVIAIAHSSRAPEYWRGRQ